MDDAGSGGNEMVQTFKKKTFREARNILNDLCIRLDGKEASTNKVVSETRNLEGMTERWWLDHDDTCPPHDSPRSRAYLAAYSQIGGPVFFGSGIPLNDGGLLQPDRGVMKSMLLAECVTLGVSRRGLFELTQKGKDLIAGIVHSDIGSG